MKEPLVDLEFTHDDRLRLLACVCSGHVFRKKVSYTRNVVVALDLFSNPLWYGIEQFGSWKRKSKGLFNHIREKILSRVYPILWEDLEAWAKHLVEFELPELPKLIESEEEASEIAALHCLTNPEVMPACTKTASIRDQCLRRGLRHRTAALRATPPPEVEDEPETVERTVPERTFDEETGTHKVSVDSKTMARMNALFSKVKGAD